MVVKIERKRYMLVEFMGKVPEKRDLIYKLRDTVAVLGGQLALAQCSLHVIDVKDQYAIIRAAHSYRDLVEAALQILRIPNTQIVVRTVTGTISKINNMIDTMYQDNDTMTSD